MHVVGMACLCSIRHPWETRLGQNTLLSRWATHVAGGLLPAIVWELIQGCDSSHELLHRLLELPPSMEAGFSERAAQEARAWDFCDLFRGRTAFPHHTL